MIALDIWPATALLVAAATIATAPSTSLAIGSSFWSGANVWISPVTAVLQVLIVVYQVYLNIQQIKLNKTQLRLQVSENSKAARLTLHIPNAERRLDPNATSQDVSFVIRNEGERRADGGLITLYLVRTPVTISAALNGRDFVPIESPSANDEWPWNFHCAKQDQIVVRTALGPLGAGQRERGVLRLNNLSGDGPWEIKIGWTLDWDGGRTPLRLGESATEDLFVVRDVLINA